MGLNGVATFARAGRTVRAERDPLREAELDEEGRCVLTFHGAFAVFNVYIPNSGESSVRLPFKMRFLAALRARMAQVRAVKSRPGRPSRCSYSLCSSSGR
jgi:exonuclease III